MRPGFVHSGGAMVAVRSWQGRAAQEALAKVKRSGSMRSAPCVICGRPIDYRLPSSDPRGCSVQHLKARSRHPELTWVASNWAPAHLECNKRWGDRDLEVAAPSSRRQVVCLFGPPGAGKTTEAHRSGLPVYDRDDERWSSEAEFAEALRLLGQDPDARAVVVRTGATSSARARIAKLVNATACRLIAADERTLRARIAKRGRSDAMETSVGVKRWFDAFDDADGIRAFTTWDDAMSFSAETKPTNPTSGW